MKDYIKHMLLIKYVYIALLGAMIVMNIAAENLMSVSTTAVAVAKYVQLCGRIKFKLYVKWERC